MAGRPHPDIIASRRDPDRRRSALWRLLAVVTAAALIAGISVQHFLGGSGSRPHHKARHSVSTVTLAAPLMLHGTTAGRGEIPDSVLFLGGQDLRLLAVPAGCQDRCLTCSLISGTVAARSAPIPLSSRSAPWPAAS